MLNRVIVTRLFSGSEKRMVVAPENGFGWFARSSNRAGSFADVASSAPSTSVDVDSPILWAMDEPSLSHETMKRHSSKPLLMASAAPERSAAEAPYVDRPARARLASSRIPAGV